MNVQRLLTKWPVSSLIRAACYLGLVALAMMVVSIVYPRPLMVILGMSIGQGVGVLAFLCYLLAVLGDAARSAPATLPPSPSSSDTNTH